MTLDKVLEGVSVLGILGSRNVDITGVRYDSRQVRAGNLFAAVPGEHVDGHAFIGKAVAAGAAALLSERSADRETQATWVQVANIRRALAQIAANFYGHPARGLKLVGVTGTNGKTTTTYLLESVLRAAGQRVALFGTVEYRTAHGVLRAPQTTPEAVDLQRYLAELREAGGEWVVMEVSSHALALERVYACPFAAAVFTNLGRDHLDFHQTFENYFAAKKQLFLGCGTEPPALAVINADDAYGRELLSVSSGRRVAYSLEANGGAVTTRKAQLTASGIRFALQTPAGSVGVESPLVGRSNLWNLLAAGATAFGLGLRLETIAAGLGALESVPGRFERVDLGQPFTVVVDFAHTEQALKILLETARELTRGRVLVVFGCGGDRDRSKRPVMGEIAGRLADQVVLTSDNPRSEDPLRIINDIVVGAQKAGGNYVVEEEREAAIERAFDLARAGDIVLVAGKGHQDTLIYKDRVEAWSDIEAARRLLARRGYADAAAARSNAGWERKRIAAPVAWTVKEIGEALGVAAAVSAASEKLTGFSIDSRTLRAGELFIAIKGPNYDGHDFVAEAFSRGAAAAVVGEERRGSYPAEWGEKLVGVPDTFVALQQLGRAARRRWGRTVMGVTGSTGKTTTKELLAALLATRCRVLKSEGNLNNEFGVPLTLLRLEATHEVAVIEMAMSHKGELAKLCQVAEPNVGVVTNVAPVHLEFFASLEEIAEAKRELIRGLAPPATAVLNADDPRVSRFAEGFSGRVVCFGLENPAEVRAENISDHGCLGSEFDLVTAQERGRVSLPLPGRAHIANAVAAFAAASLHGVGVREAAKVLANFEPASLRGDLVSFPAGFTVVNDAYNSNPRALAAMAEALSRTPGARRRIVVAGEMKELGTVSPELHRQTGAQLAALGNIDFLAGVTGDAVHLVEGAVAAGFPRARALFFETRGAASGWLCGVLEPGDWVLLKASRGVGIETVLEALRSYFAPEPVATNAAAGKE